MIEGDKVFGVPVVWIVFITLFFFVIAEIIFGPDSMGNGTIRLIVVFLSISVTFLVGSFGWQILIIPSSIILLATAWVVWKLLN
jgi:hypothetical protein